MVLRDIEKTVLFNGVEVKLQATVDQCDSCSLESANIERAGKIQKRLLAAYQEAVGMIDSNEIKAIANKHKTDKGRGGKSPFLFVKSER